MLALLNDGPEEDSVGLEAEMLTGREIGVCERLAGRDFVRFDIGWRHSCWFRLTPAGRAALEVLDARSRHDPRPKPDDDRNRKRSRTHGQT